VLSDAARNHLSWFARHRERFDLDGVAVFIGAGDAVLAFPDSEADLAAAVALAREYRPQEIGCWSLEPDEALGARLSELGFQDGWQPHWMGIEVTRANAEPEHRVEESTVCNSELPYWSELHEGSEEGVQHLVVRDASTLVGHAVLNLDGNSGGLYDMGVLPSARRRGYARGLTLAALGRARLAGCSGVTLNATHEGELVYREVGFQSLGRGMTWWLFPR
jgi:GNAT superfamily N-acetyltransferase